MMAQKGLIPVQNDDNENDKEWYNMQLTTSVFCYVRNK